MIAVYSKYVLRYSYYVGHAMFPGAAEQPTMVPAEHELSGDISNKLLVEFLLSLIPPKFPFVGWQIRQMVGLIQNSPVDYVSKFRLGDHGEYDGGIAFGSKMPVFVGEASLHVPLMIRPVTTIINVPLEISKSDGYRLTT